LPEPTKAGAIATTRKRTGTGTSIPNGLPKDDQELWDRVGWAPRFGPGKEAKEDDGTTMLDHQTWLEGQLEDKWYGDWYHNTGIIIFCGLTSWVIGVLGGGLG